MAAERVRVMSAMREIHETLLVSPADPELSEELRESWGPRLVAIVTVACAREGITPDEYRAAVDGDPELGELHRKSLYDACCGSIDPGPYDVFSPRDPPLSGAQRNGRDRDKAPIG